MKTLLLSLLLFLCILSTPVCSQPVQGTITPYPAQGFKLIKIWGTHQERGYAYGYLAGSQITTLVNNYVKLALSGVYNTARTMMTNGNDFVFDSLYIVEAKAMIAGMNAAQSNTTNLDYVDLLVSNSILDVMAVTKKKSGLGCSSLMSWDSATSGTTLAGQSVVSRHLDWQINANLINNQVIVISIPSEPDEQTWALVGFAGMFTALSGFNADMAAFQHQLDDVSAIGVSNQQYTPIWFCLRKALEKKDYNGDGQNNVQDLRSVLLNQANGFADAYILTSLARSSQLVDSLIAMVAEVAPVNPYRSIRYNAFPDSIPGDNLYASNFSISRNNAMNFDSRYNGIRSHIGNGTALDALAQWNLMKDYSHQSTNLQFMQFSPEANLFRISVYGGGQAAYLRPYLDFDVLNLFANPVGMEDVNTFNSPVQVFPNPFQQSLHIAGLPLYAGDYTILISDIMGKPCFKTTKQANSETTTLNVPVLSPGPYFIKISSSEGIYHQKIIRVP